MDFSQESIQSLSRHFYHFGLVVIEIYSYSFLFTVNLCVQSSILNCKSLQLLLQLQLHCQKII